MGRSPKRKSEGFDSTQIISVLPNSVIVKIYSYIKKQNSQDLEFKESMISSIEEYIDHHSPRWIYYPVLRANRELRYIILLQHYFDRNPREQLEVNSVLPQATHDLMEKMKKSFKLGC